MLDPVTLYNEGQLTLIVPPPSSTTPPRSTLAPSTDSTTATDEWINSLLQSQQRATTYYDESLTFYLVFSLSSSSSSLSRSQAHSFFLQSLSEPHLTLASSLSYYEAAALRPPPPPRTQSALTSHYPLTPNPHPSTSTSTPTADPTTRESVHVSSKPFQQIDAEDEEEDAEEKSKVWVGQTKEGNWVGVWEFHASLPFIQTSFYEPKLAVTVTVTFRDDPKLSKILSTHGKDSGVNGSRQSSEMQRGEVEEEEDYMDDSYDDVNLLSSLGTSHSFHLPFSRLPSSFLPPLSTSAPPISHSRRHSRTQSLTSETGLPASTESASPLLRRSILKTFELRKPVQVSIRTIDCSIPDQNALSASQSNGESQDGGGGMVVLLELVGPGEAGEQFEISDIQVKAGSSKSGSASSLSNAANDLEVKRVATTDEVENGQSEKSALGGNDQFNFVYKLALSPSSQLLDQQQQQNPSYLLSAATGPNGGNGFASVPIGVATSPSQRFTARFGSGEEDGNPGEYEEEEMDRRRERERERERKQREDMFRRNLEVVVTGRILVKRERELEGYTVGDAAETSREKEEWTSPTREISSRWNYSIDISSFAYRPPPLQAHFLPPSAAASTSRQLVRPSSIAAPQIPLLPPSALRPTSTSAATANNSDRTEVESIAGSKRHTMASLASLSLKSPVLGRKGSFAPLPSSSNPPNNRPTPQRHSSNRPSPLPPLATPGATGNPAAGPRRFFSLPPASQESVSTPTTATPTNANFFANRRQIETPPPMPMPSNPVSPAVARNSLPLPAQANSNSETNRRTSWMSGLGIGKGGSNVQSQEGVTSWDTVDNDNRGGAGRTNRESAGLGLGFDGNGSNSPLPPLPSQSSLPPRPSEIDNPQYYQYSQPVQNGRVLITVSLVPLRTVKSRRHLDQLINSRETDSSKIDLPPATLPGLTTTLSPPASHHASFNFPPSSPSSPTSPSSPADSPNLNGRENSNPFSDAERTALLSSRMPRVGLLDVFLVQLFVVNQTDQVKRFVVGVPPARLPGEDGNRELGKPNGHELGVRSIRSGTQAASGKAEKEEFATLVPLENDVRIGPLAPNSCASLGLRMLAISPGAHVLEELKLVDLADGSETRLKRPLWVVVE